MLVIHGFQPLVRSILAHLGGVGEMLKPRVFGSSVPVFYLCGYGDNGAGCHLYRFLAPFLIPTSTSHADEHLCRLMMDMPVVAAGGFESHVHRSALFSIHRG